MNRNTAAAEAVEVTFTPDLVLVLDALGIPWTEGRPANGTAGTVLVPMDGDLDGRLERLVGDLADLRWRYTPGRRLQLAFEFLEAGDDPLETH